MIAPGKRPLLALTPPLLFVGALVLLAAISAASTHRIGVLVSEAEWESHTHQVLGTLESLRRALVSAEDARRAFVLAAEPRFRQAMDESVREVEATLEELRRRTGNNPAQQDRVRELEPLLERRLAQLAVAAGADRADAAAQRALVLEGSALSARVQEVLAVMEKSEEALLVERSEAARSTAGATMRISVLSGSVATAVVLLGLLLFVRETRRRRRAEEAVRAADLQHQAFFEQSLDLACIAALDGYLRKVNASWERTLGWTGEELLARPWLDFVHPDDRPATVEAANELAKGVEIVRFENRYRCRDGSYRWLSWRVPAPAAGSTVLYAIARDVTANKEAEAKLRTLNAALEERSRAVLEANRELEAFSYSVSHDLRAPLRHAGGFADLLERHLGPGVDEKGRRFLKTITGSVTRMGRLIDDLLAFSRTGRSELRPERVTMSRLVDEVRLDLAGEAAGRAIAWDVRPLPDARGDVSLLRQVWANLLSNAVKYTRNRSDARIEVGCSPQNGHGPVYYVRDNGAGFDMKYADKLFGVFQRLHAGHEFEGTGIGLANAKRIVSRHGGRIWAEGKVGEGAAFYFTLPSATETPP